MIEAKAFAAAPCRADARCCAFETLQDKRTAPGIAAPLLPTRRTSAMVLLGSNAAGQPSDTKLHVYFIAAHGEHLTGATDHRCFDTARGLAELGRSYRIEATCMTCFSMRISARRGLKGCSANRRCVMVHVKEICNFLLAAHARPEIHNAIHVHDVVDGFNQMFTVRLTQPLPKFAAKLVNTAAMARDGEQGVIARAQDASVLQKSEGNQTAPR